MPGIKARTAMRTPRLTICTLTRVAALMLLASGLFSCGQKEGGASNSTPVAGSPQAAPPVSTSATTSAPALPASSPKRIFKTGEVVPAGYIGYKVYSSWFSDHPSNNTSDKPSNAGTYLYIDLSVVNTDKKERAVGPFKLIDEKGKEYSPSERASMVERSVGQLGKLSPGSSKRALVIFEAPKGHEYRLRIQGFAAEDQVMIELSPKAGTP